MHEDDRILNQSEHSFGRDLQLATRLHSTLKGELLTRPRTPPSLPPPEATLSNCPPDEVERRRERAGESDAAVMKSAF